MLQATLHPQAHVSKPEGPDTTQPNRQGCSMWSHVVTVQRCTLPMENTGPQIEGTPKSLDRQKPEPFYPGGTWLLMTMPLTGEVPKWLNLTTSFNTDVCWIPGTVGAKTLFCTGRMEPSPSAQLIVKTSQCSPASRCLRR